MNQLTNIRQPVIADVNYLLDIDLKATDDPLDIMTWRKICLDEKTDKLVGVYFSSPVAFILWQRLEDSFEITRLAVKPDYRRQGIGTQLLKAVEKIAHQSRCYVIKIEVPEHLCGSGLTFSTWLQKKDFKATKIIRDSFTYCGEVEDKFLFTSIIRE